MWLLQYLRARSSSDKIQLGRIPAARQLWYLGVFEISDSYFFGSVEIPAVLAILPSDEGDLALSSALGALEAVVVAGLHGTPEESATRRTNLIHISWKRGKNVKSEMKSFFFRAFKNVCCLFLILSLCIICGIHPAQSCILQQTQSVRQAM